MFLVPLIMIMLMQSMIIIGTLVVRKIGGMLQEYSSSMMSRLVENRKVILQNDMIQRWASVRDQEVLMDEILKQFLNSEKVGFGKQGSGAGGIFCFGGNAERIFRAAFSGMPGYTAE